jgi:hypothetical protein
VPRQPNVRPYLCQVCPRGCAKTCDRLLANSTMAHFEARRFLTCGLLGEHGPRPLMASRCRNFAPAAASLQALEPMQEADQGSGSNVRGSEVLCLPRVDDLLLLGIGSPTRTATAAAPGGRQRKVGPRDLNRHSNARLYTTRQRVRHPTIDPAFASARRASLCRRWLPRSCDTHVTHLKVTAAI